MAQTQFKTVDSPDDFDMVEVPYGRKFGGINPNAGCLLGQGKPIDLFQSVKIVLDSKANRRNWLLLAQTGSFTIAELLVAG